MHGFVLILKDITYEPSSKVTTTQGYHFPVWLRSAHHTSFPHNTPLISSPCQQYLRLWTEFHFVQTPWWLWGRQLCSCDVVLTDGCLPGLAPDRELRRSAGGLVWPKFLLVRWFVCWFAVAYAFEEVILIGESEYLHSWHVGSVTGMKGYRKSCRSSMLLFLFDIYLR